MKATSKHWTLKNNAIFNSRFYTSGVPLDEESLKSIPENIRKELIPYKPAEPESDHHSTPASLNFQLGVNYGFDSQGNRRRIKHLERQAAELCYQAEQDEALDQIWQKTNDALDPATLSDAQEQYEIDLERQKAQAIVTANNQDAADKIEKIESDIEYYDVTIPAPDGQEWRPSEPTKPKPKLMRRRYINRNGIWKRTKQMKHFNPGEDVFIRNGPNDFEKIGVVNKQGHLPAAPYIEEN